jgi:hypothetical protein
VEAEAAEESIVLEVALAVPILMVDRPTTDNVTSQELWRHAPTSSPYLSRGK